MNLTNRCLATGWALLCASPILVSAASLAVSQPLARLSFTPAPDRVTITQGTAPVISYRFANVPFKPYVQSLFTPTGIDLLRDAPSDHLHHHSLMFALSVDDVDFWGERVAPKPGRQQPSSPLKQRVRHGSQFTAASLAQDLDWIEVTNGIIRLREARLIEGMRLASDPDCTLLTWRSRLKPGPKARTVNLGGSHYFGLGMRFPVSMDKTGEFFFAAPGVQGEVVRGDERLTRSPWCAFHSTAGGKPVTVAMFDHPKNPRHPAYWFTMQQPFSYLSATLNLWREPMPLGARQKLDLVYGVAVWEGHVDRARLAAVYEKWQQYLPPQR